MLFPSRFGILGCQFFESLRACTTKEHKVLFTVPHSNEECMGGLFWWRSLSDWIQDEWITLGRVCGLQEKSKNVLQAMHCCWILPVPLTTLGNIRIVGVDSISRNRRYYDHESSWRTVFPNLQARTRRSKASVDGTFDCVAFYWYSFTHSISGTVHLEWKLTRNKRVRWR